MANGVLLGREHLLAAEFASREDGRGQITNVHVRTDGTVEATNGHFAIQVPPATIPSEDFPVVAGMGGSFEGSLQIPAETCKAVLKVLPKRPTLPILATAHVGAKDGKAVITTTDLEVGIPRCVVQTDSKFPDIDRVVPKSDEGIKVCMNAAYLKAIADYAIKVGAVGITLSVKNGKDVLRFDVKLNDGQRVAVIALMPMRI